MRREVERSVRDAIATLPATEREVVLLYCMGDHAHATIAEFLGVTANAVKTRLYSARQRLRTRMSDIEEGLDAARPSKDARFVEKVKRMIRPDDSGRAEARGCVAAGGETARVRVVGRAAAPRLTRTEVHRAAENRGAMKKESVSVIRCLIRSIPNLNLKLKLNAVPVLIVNLRR